MTNHRKGQIGLIIVAIIWGSGFTASAIALEHFTPFQILALRFSIACFIMLLLFNKQLKEIKRSAIWKGAALGVILYLAFYFQTVGLQYTTASKNAFLTAVNVIIVPFLSALFFRTKINGKTIIGAILALAGVAFMSLNEFGRLNYGDVLTLICALMFALQIIFTSYYVKDENIFNLNTIQMGTAALIGIFFSLIQGDSLPSVTFEGGFSIFYLGAISTMLAFLLQTASQLYTMETETAIILSSEAVFGMVFSALILGENITGRMLIGALFILIGAIIVQYKSKKGLEIETNE